MGADQYIKMKQENLKAKDDLRKLLMEIDRIKRRQSGQNAKDNQNTNNSQNGTT